MHGVLRKLFHWIISKYYYVVYQFVRECSCIRTILNREEDQVLREVFLTVKAKCPGHSIIFMIVLFKYILFLYRGSPNKRWLQSQTKGIWFILNGVLKIIVIIKTPNQISLDCLKC